jgi:hypothetical protein
MWYMIEFWKINKLIINNYLHRWVGRFVHKKNTYLPNIHTYLSYLFTYPRNNVSKKVGKWVGR